MFLRNLRRWRGVLLLAPVVAVTLWLGATGRLVLFIHPRYLVFTVVMAVIALAFSVAGALLWRDEGEGDEIVSRRRSVRMLSVAGVGIAGLLVLAMVVLPPATLTSTTATQRDITQTTAGADAQSVDEAASASDAVFAGFTVVDWSSLLRQTSDPAFYADKPVDVVGFITPDPEDPENSFYVSRFIVTCCAVDAQPIGVPVYSPDWQSTNAADEWVRVTGEFGTNPSRTSGQAIAITPAEVVVVDEPGDPYLF